MLPGDRLLPHTRPSGDTGPARSPLQIRHRSAPDQGRGPLQGTSLPFIVAAAQIGLELGAISLATGAALVPAGLLSVLIFPLLALTVLRGEGRAQPEPEKAQEVVKAVGSEM